MATTPVFVNAPSGLSGLILNLAAEPSVGDLDPALANGGDALTELTNIQGWYKADISQALAGIHIGTVETSAADAIGTFRFDMVDSTTPIFEVSVDTPIAELGVAQPAKTPGTRTGLMLMYMALRNKLDVPTSGVDALEIHNDAGTLITSKLLTDVGGDYSEAKMT